VQKSQPKHQINTYYINFHKPKKLEKFNSYYVSEILYSKVSK